MIRPEIERRKYVHYNTELKVYFQVKYDIKTKVTFQIVEESLAEHGHKYSGVCENVSVEGICFVSTKKMRKGDFLLLGVCPPKARKPVEMEGQVRWCRKLRGRERGRSAYHTGVLLISVKRKLIVESIYFDKEYKVMWSEALNSLFGNFAAISNSPQKK